MSLFITLLCEQNKLQKDIISNIMVKTFVKHNYVPGTSFVMDENHHILGRENNQGIISPLSTNEKEELTINGFIVKEKCTALTVKGLRCGNLSIPNEKLCSLHKKYLKKLTTKEEEIVKENSEKRKEELVEPEEKIKIDDIKPNLVVKSDIGFDLLDDLIKKCREMIDT